MQEINNFVNKHTALILVWIILLILVILTTLKSFFINKRLKFINHHEAIFLINKRKARIVDVRSCDAYCKGHIPGAINVIAEDIIQGRLNTLEKYKLQPIIVVCTTGQNIMNMGLKLNSAGFAQVFILKDGIHGWNHENLPIVSSK